MTEQLPRRPFRVTSSKMVWSSPWYSIRQDELVTPSGAPAVYNVTQLPGASWVIPVTRTGEIVLIYIYRYPVDAWCWEVPAGGIHTGDTPEETARRELREEIGGEAEELIDAGSFYTANAVSNEVAHIFIATGVTLGTPQHEPTEIIEIHPKQLDDVLRMVHAHEMSDGPSALALLLCEPRLREIAARATR